MGGKEGVLASQSMALSTLQPEGGLWVHCSPRRHGIGARTADDQGLARAGSSGQLAALPEHPGESCALPSGACCMRAAIV